MPKLVDHDERRRAIAAAAVDAIGADGLEGAQLRTIARSAGVTTGAVTHYFPDKDAVLLAALEEVCARLFARMAEPFSADPLDDLASVLPLDDEGSLAEWKVWLAFWGRAAFVPRLRAVHQRYYRRIEDELARQLATPDAGQTAAAIIAAIDGIGTRVALEPEQWPAERQRTLLGHMISPLLAGEPRHAQLEASAA